MWERATDSQGIWLFVVILSSAVSYSLIRLDVYHRTTQKDIKKTLRIKRGSSGIWSDKVSLLHINVTQRVGEHGGESIKDNIAEVPKAQRAIEP